MMGVRSYTKGPRIYLDMDGVVADFERMMHEKSLDAHRLKLIPGTYINLEPMPGAINGINQLLDQGFNIFILTKIPSKNPYAAAEKLMWVRKHLPRLEDHVIVTPDKGCVGRRIDFLVDDHPEWANAHNFPGSIIQFGVDEAEEIEGVKLFSSRNWDELFSWFMIKKNFYGLGAELRVRTVKEESDDKPKDDHWGVR